jgi:hypothetical protein
MKKALVTMFTILFLLLFTSGIAFGNAFTLQAENGRILPPAGLGIELNGAYQSGQNAAPLYDTQLSYGITPAITIAGEFTSVLKSGSSSQTSIKALYSPTSKGNGYTLYGDYDLNQSKISLYGISLWADSRFLYTYANLEARNAIPNQLALLVLTPGVNFKIGSKLILGGEAEFNTKNWNSQELRVGAGYYLNSKVAVKFTFKTGLSNQPDRIYQTGIAVEL